MAAGLLPVLSGARVEEKLTLDPRIALAEEERIKAIEKVKMSVVAVFSHNAQTGGVEGSGSGVIISEDGYALTNFHVVAGLPPVMFAGLADGNLYDAVVVGQDKVGDVALIKVLPPKDKPGFKFQPAPLGDSDQCKAGDWSLAMGNPFLLATDYTPTVTFGLISGVNRYQYPEGKFIEYTDCIQIDTSINPGNSGGPLFNMKGELIGINGRGSFDKRVRINSGVGYAISINQIKNFMGHLRCGLFVDHASAGYLVESTIDDDGPLGKVTVKTMIPSDAARRGIEVGDEIVTFAGWPITSVNVYKNKLGIFPRGWRVPISYRHGNDNKKEVLVRLMGVIRKEIMDPKAKPDDGTPPAPGPARPVPNSPAKEFYEAKPGYSNYYYNKKERERILKQFHDTFGKFDEFQGNWKISSGGGTLIKGKRALGSISILHEGAKEKLDLVESVMDGLKDAVVPLDIKGTENNLKDPPGSGGLLVAMYHYRQLLALGEKGFDKQLIEAAGVEPFYLPPPEKAQPVFKDMRVDCDVLRTEFAAKQTKFYFAQKDEKRVVLDKTYNIKKGQLIGFETQVDSADDPCEVYLFEYQPTDGGRMMPSEIVVRYKEANYAVLNKVTFELAKAK
jgi:S1-C subfamily serine protease